MRILKPLYFALLISLFCNSCKKSPTYTGKYADEPIVEAAYKVELLSVELLSFSFPASAYAANDAGSGPEVYFRFDTDDNSSKRKYTYDQVYNNMLPSNLPYKFIFSVPVLLYSYEKVKILSKPQSFSELYVVGGLTGEGRIFMTDYDGPAAFSPLSIYNQSLTNFYIGDFIFKPGINKVITVSGDAIIEYKITKI